MSPYELAVGLRYTRARRGPRRNAFISFISFASMAGIALGVAALIVVLSVVNGFHQEVRDRMLSVASHVEIRGAPTLRDDIEAARIARANPRVTAVAPFVNGYAMLSAGDASRGMLLRGIDPAREPAVSDIGSQMRAGKLVDLVAGEFGIVLGAELARALGANVGDSLVLVVPQQSSVSAGMLPALRTVRVAGVFEVGMFDFDNGLALVHIDDARTLYRLEGVSGLRLKLDDLFAAPRVARELSTALQGIDVRDWTRSNANFFRAVATAKRLMSIMLTLIIAVAAFNVVSAQVMTVTEKRADIAILRTLGASPTSILAVFVIQGALIGILGVAIGVAGGLAIAYNIDVVVPAMERVLGVQFIDKSIYRIGELPSQVQAADVVTVAAVTLVLALSATIYPAWRAARVRPAEALRYE